MSRAYWVVCDHEVLIDNEPAGITMDFRHIEVHPKPFQLGPEFGQFSP